jgi:ABC-2 type transport system permease protein
MRRRHPDMLAIFRRELKAYFRSPIGYIFMGFFLLLSGIMYSIGNLLQANSRYTPLLDTLNFVFLLVVPILTMRLLSEERGQKTDQLLLTSPLSVTDIVVGKYLAAVGVFLITLLITVIYPVIMSFFVFGGMAWPEIIGGYVGFFLMGASFVSVGLFFSSVTDNQIIAAVVTFGALLLIYILDWVSQYVPTDAVSGLVFLSAIAVGVILLTFFSTRNLIVTVCAGVVLAAAIVLLYIFQRDFFYSLIANILTWFSLLKRFSDFVKGIFSVSPIVYYLSFSAMFVFLTTRMVERRRWV